MSKPTRKEILTLVEESVCKNRQDIYGPPEDSFSTIADFWSVYLSRHPQGALQPHDVAAMMALMKIARIVANPAHMDNWVDLTGYGACGGETAPQPPQQATPTDTCSPATSRSPADGLSLDEIFEVSTLGHKLNSVTIKKWDEMEGATIIDAVLRPSTLKFAQLNYLRNLAK